MSNLTITEKRIVGRYVRETYESRNPRDVRFGNDGAVSVMIDEMPNTNQPGRIFVGWDTDLLREAK
ncbi:MAG TPA: hypothetical protein PK225_14185 [Azonexus sp.]|jgi:hypothetical protein|uniref:hypothetical protein n=1 Tax=Zoogloea sp. TaxID=49181 RepID=UPI002C41D691|nr:hypothetical protein [Zoogloea sp.]HNH16427.1 hypothetical protein [Zoogloea sp.]HRH15483.1 hypothetical protein [Azonexus sp.]